MTWWGVGTAAVEIGAGAYQNNKNRQATDAAGNKLTTAQQAAQELQMQRYQDAQNTLSPYLNSSKVANNQLMVELGLGGQYQDAQHQSNMNNLADLQKQLAALQAQQAAPVAKTSNKSKHGGLLGKLEDAGTKVTGGNAKQSLNPLQSIKGSLNTVKYITSGGKSNMTPDGKPIDNATAIANIQQQIADAQKAVDGYSPNSQPAAQPGTAYMNTPAYQGAIAAGTNAVNTGAANSGDLYSGARGVGLRDVGQNVQQSFYTNWMNLLQNMANPATATNLSNIGINQAGNIGAQNLAATQMVNGVNMAGTQANNAFMSDAAGGLSSAFTAYMNRPNQNKVGYAPKANSTPMAGDPSMNSAQVMA